MAVVAYIGEAGWAGACHATSAATYLLLGGELRVACSVCVGEAALGPVVFDHSWLESGDVYDPAICHTLYADVQAPPTFSGVDLETLGQPQIRYGVMSGTPPFADAIQILNMPFEQFMWGYPGHPEGLWGITTMIGERIGLSLETRKLEEQYRKTKWTVRYQGTLPLLQS
jgi:hypothetical protein